MKTNDSEKIISEYYQEAAERVLKPKKGFLFYAILALVALLLISIPLAYLLAILLPDHWSSVFGSVFTGLMAYVGVVFSIQYYRRSNREYERLKIMPYLDVTVIETGGEVKAEDDIPEGEDVIVSPEYGMAEQTGIWLKMTIRNVGYGFAKVLSFWFEGNNLSVTVNKMLTTEEQMEAVFVMPKSNSYPFFLTFVDPRMQLYAQRYSLCRDGGRMVCKSNVPMPIEGVLDRNWYE